MKFSLQKALFVSFLVLTLGSFFSPLKSNRVSSVGHAAGVETGIVGPQTASAAVPTLAAVETYLNRLLSRGCPPSAQAILIQTLDGQVLVEHNADVPLNPASVMKLFTTYAGQRAHEIDFDPFAADNACAASPTFRSVRFAFTSQQLGAAPHLRLIS